MGAFDQSVPDLSKVAMAALIRWGNLRKIAALSTEDPMFRLLAAKAVANTLHWAKEYGLLLVALLAERGFLSPEEDPCMVLKKLIPEKATIRIIAANPLPMPAIVPLLMTSLERARKLVERDDMWASKDETDTRIGVSRSDLIKEIAAVIDDAVKSMVTVTGRRKF